MSRKLEPWMKDIAEAQRSLYNRALAGENPSPMDAGEASLIPQHLVKSACAALLGNHGYTPETVYANWAGPGSPLGAVMGALPRMDLATLRILGASTHIGDALRAAYTWAEAHVPLDKVKAALAAAIPTVTIGPFDEAALAADPAEEEPLTER